MLAPERVLRRLELELVDGSRARVEIDALPVGKASDSRSRRALAYSIETELAEKYRDIQRTSHTARSGSDGQRESAGSGVNRHWSVMAAQVRRPLNPDNQSCDDASMGIYILMVRFMRHHPGGSMWLRIISLMIMASCATTDGSTGTDHATDGQTQTISQTISFQCVMTQPGEVVCTGQINGILIVITIRYEGTVDGSEMAILAEDLDRIAVLDMNATIARQLGDAKATVLNDFLNKFNIAVTSNDITICATVSNFQVCQ